MSFVSQTVAGILRGNIGSSNNNNNQKCNYCENYTCQKHHFTQTKPSEEYKNYITLLQQCSSETTNSEETTTSESESLLLENNTDNQVSTKITDKKIILTNEKRKKVNFSD